MTQPARIYGRRLTPDQQARFDTYVLLDGSDDGSDKHAAKRGLRELREELEAANRAEMADLDSTETVALRRRMGQVVERNIDGMWQRETALMQLFIAGKLGGTDVAAERLYELGVLYTDCYEKVMGLRTAAKQEVRGSGGGAQEAITDAGQTLAILRFRQPLKNIRVLDAVCGDDMTPWAMRQATGVHEVTITKRLVHGLLGAAENRGV